MGIAMDSNAEAHQQEHCSVETKGKKGKAKAILANF
jgi:hypothetical protein